MTQLQKDCLRNRAELILQNLKMTNSGCDVHPVGNMRGIAMFIIEHLNEHDADYITLSDMLCRLEQTQVEFFKKKFQHLYKSNGRSSKED